MAYAVKEIFYTLQGEGMNAGRAAVFCRFSGCNLWSGREQDRAQAVCQFCDTDFFGTDGDGGGKFGSAEELADAVAEKWPKHVAGQRFVVCTGGEPLLQLDAALIEALHERGFWIAVETNGTIAVPEAVDWVCVSPKANAELVVTRGDELKVVYPQATDPNEYLGMEFKNFFIQPMDGPEARASLIAAIEFCQQNPVWRLSLQTHKMIGIR
ncbi:MAG TPA: 7-carboxy-7-deazaguanine synthase [Bryocella sp.]|nr:7-carboxy-7-deazaguanine synthase [Bryocella sp.]